MGSTDNTNNPEAQALAEAFFAAGIIRVMQHDSPFTLTSGRLSPVYVNCRAVMGHVALRDRVIEGMANCARRALAQCQDASSDRPAVIVGGESAGINYAALVADRMKLPTGYVRKAPRAHGLGLQIEGVDVEGRDVILIEDLMTDGGSKLVFLEALKAAGAHCRAIVVAFGYGVFPAAWQRIESEWGVTTHCLFTWHDVVRTPSIRQALGKQRLHLLESFMANPLEWQPTEIAPT